MKIDYTEFEEQVRVKREEVVTMLAGSDCDLDAEERASHLADFETQMERQREKFELRTRAKSFAMALCDLAEEHGHVLEMFVTSCDGHRMISFNPKVVSHGPLNPILRLGLATYVYEAVKENIK